MTFHTPKRPAGHEWTRIEDVGPMERWRSGPVLVCSEATFAEAPDGNGTTPQWLVSVSASGKRPKPHHVRRALRAFGMIGAEENNHHPGVARHYWMVVDPMRRVDCECKTDEAVVTEHDGYRWSNPKLGSGEECRGCEYRRLFGRPCPIHAMSEEAKT